jgi:hypothetical protein
MQCQRSALTALAVGVDGTKCNTTMSRQLFHATMKKPAAKARPKETVIDEFGNCRQRVVAEHDLCFWHGPCLRAWHDQDLQDSNSDSLAFM